MADEKRIPARACAIEEAASDEKARYIFEFLRLCDGIVDAKGLPIELSQLAFARLPESLEAPNTFLVGLPEAIGRIRFNPVKRVNTIEMGVVDPKGNLTQLVEFQVTGLGGIPNDVVRYDGEQVKRRFEQTPFNVARLPDPFNLQPVPSFSIVLIGCVATHKDFSPATGAINCALPVPVGQ